MISALSKLRIVTNSNWLPIVYLVAGYSFLPLLLDPNSFPPGDDPVRLEKVAQGWSHYYYGFLPIKLTGVTLYYYSTFLIMFGGLWAFFRDRIPALAAWTILLFLVPTIYLNMVSGAWINVVNFFGLALITIRLFTEWLDGKSAWYGIAAAGLSFTVPLFHNETGGYLAAGLGTYFLIRHPLKLYAVIPIMLAMYLVIFHTSGGRGADLVNLQEVNRTETIIFTNPNDGKTTQAIISRNEVKKAEKLGRITIRYGGDSLVFSITEVSVINLDVAYWVTNFLTPNLIIPIIIITTLSALMWGRGVLKRIPDNLLILAAALPAMAFLTFSPWAMSPPRIGIHLVSIVAIWTAYFAVENWRHFGTEVRWIFVAVFGYLILINTVNSLAVWITARA